MGIKIKRETTTEKKNALGRKVVVNRNASGNEAVSKTRTVYSKSGGVISEKKSYKDRESIAGKMLENKVGKQMYGKKVKLDKSAREGAKMGSKPLKGKNDRNKVSRIDNKIERLENRKQRIGSDEGMNKRQFERASNIRKKQYELTKKRNAL